VLTVRRLSVLGVGPSALGVVGRPSERRLSVVNQCSRFDLRSDEITR